MKKFEKNFLVICDSVIKDDSGKLSLIGIYNVVQTKQLPAVHPKFVLVGNIKILDESIDKISVKIELIDGTGKIINSDIPSIEVTSITKNDFSKVREHNIIYEIGMVKFDKEGKYAFRVTADLEEIGDAEFFLVKLSQ